MTTWRDTATIPEDAKPRPDAVDAVVAALPASQRVLLACRSLRFEMNAWVAQMPTIVLTDQALIIAKDRLFGKPKADRMVALEEIEATGCGPLLGVGPTWEVVFRTRRHFTASMYFSGPVPAEQVHKLLQSVLLSVAGSGRSVGSAAGTPRRQSAMAQEVGTYGDPAD